MTGISSRKYRSTVSSEFDCDGRIMMLVTVILRLPRWSAVTPGIMVSPFKSQSDSFETTRNPSPQVIYHGGCDVSDQDDSVNFADSDGHRSVSGSI